MTDFDTDLRWSIRQWLYALENWKCRKNIGPTGLHPSNFKRYKSVQKWKLSCKTKINCIQNHNSYLFYLQHSITKKVGFLLPRCEIFQHVSCHMYPTWPWLGMRAAVIMQVPGNCSQQSSLRTGEAIDAPIRESKLCLTLRSSFPRQKKTGVQLSKYHMFTTLGLYYMVITTSRQ